jgi:hypothetical protein
MYRILRINLAVAQRLVKLEAAIIHGLDRWVIIEVDV